MDWQEIVDSFCKQTMLTEPLLGKICMVEVKTPPTPPLGQERLNSVWSFTEKVKGSKIVQLVFFASDPNCEQLPV
jgi:hypothetical protein